jgi:hypothetical protein
MRLINERKSRDPDGAGPGAGWIDRTVQSFRMAVRSLTRSPGFSSAAVFTLALGIGAVTAAFSVAYSVLLAPLPVRDPQRVVVLWGDNPSKAPAHWPLSGEEYKAFARESRVFAGTGASDYHGAAADRAVRGYVSHTAHRDGHRQLLRRPRRAPRARPIVATFRRSVRRSSSGGRE